MFSGTGSHVAQAGLRLDVQDNLDLLTLHPPPPRAGITDAYHHLWFSVGFLCVRQTLYQLSYNPSPYFQTLRSHYILPLLKVNPIPTHARESPWSPAWAKKKRSPNLFMVVPFQHAVQVTVTVGPSSPPCGSPVTLLGILAQRCGIPGWVLCPYLPGLLRPLTLSFQTCKDLWLC